VSVLFAGLESVPASSTAPERLIGAVAAATLPVIMHVSVWPAPRLPTLQTILPSLLAVPHLSDAMPLSSALFNTSNVAFTFVAEPAPAALATVKASATEVPTA